MRLFGAVLLPLLIAKPAASQQYGFGWGKATWRTSDADGTYKWVQSHLPVVEDHPNGQVNCGKVGRNRVAQSAGQQGYSQGFGLHAVHVGKESPRFHAKNCPTAVEVESELTARFASHPNSYDPFYDFSNGHWVSNLDPYLKSFRNAKQSVIVLSWDPANGDQHYFSVVARAHTSMMFVELMSAECSLCTNAITTSVPRYIFKKGEKPGDVFGALDDKTASKPLLHPAKVTWPSSDLARERKYLHEGVGAKYASHRGTGVQVDVYDFTPIMSGATVQMHVVQRSEPQSQSHTHHAKYTASWKSFESVMMKCHQATIVDDLCGENPWMDHHMGFAVHEQGQVSLDAAKLKALATKLNLPFHVTPKGGRTHFHRPGGGRGGGRWSRRPRNWGGRSLRRALQGGYNGGYAVYVIAGNGLGIAFQVETGTYTAPRAPGDGMLNLCSNGSCAKVSAVTS